MSPLNIIGLIIVGYIIWIILNEKASRYYGPAKARLHKAQAGLVAAFIVELMVMMINYFLLSTALVKILGVELFERDPILRLVFKGTHIASPHLLGIGIIFGSFGIATILVFSIKKLTELLQRNAWENQRSALIDQLGKVVFYGFLSYIIVIYIDRNLMLYRTAQMLFGNELGLTPGEMPDLPVIYKEFAGTAGVWMLRLLSFGYPALIFGTIFWHIHAQDNHQQALEEAIAEEDEIAAILEANAVDDANARQIGFDAQPPGNPGEGNAGGNGQGRTYWTRPVPDNDGNHYEGEPAMVAGEGE